MKVKELISELSKFDGNLDVICYTEDENLLAEGHTFRLLDINSSDTVEAKKCRDNNGIATLKIGKSESSSTVVMLNVTSDF